MSRTGHHEQGLIQKGGTLGFPPPPPSKSPHTLKNMHNINVYVKKKKNENI